MVARRSRERRDNRLVVERLAPELDRLVIVGSFVAPPYKPGMIDRLLVLAHHAGTDPVIVLNKVDLLDDRADAEEAAAEYRDLGYPVLVTSAVAGEGIADLRDVLAKGRAALAGHSGVGKSSLLKAVDPDVTEDIATGAVSRVTGKGKHTTTRVRLWRLRSGAEVLDLPGIRLLDLAHLHPDDIYAAFPETADALGHCQFSDCAHDPEPGCAIKVVLDEGGMTDRRRASLDRILETVVPE